MAPLQNVRCNSLKENHGSKDPKEAGKQKYQGSV